jgi:hypothetical protein
MPFEQALAREAGRGVDCRCDRVNLANENSDLLDGVETLNGLETLSGEQRAVGDPFRQSEQYAPARASWPSVRPR